MATIPFSGSWGYNDEGSWNIYTPALYESGMVEVSSGTAGAIKWRYLWVDENTLGSLA